MCQRGKGLTGDAGRARGDLYLRVNVIVPDGFERRGKDIYQNVSLDLYTAVLGGEMTVQTLNGKIKFEVPPGTQTGKVFRLNGQGLPDFRNTEIKGDYHLKAGIIIPENLTPKEKELFQ